jgi:hypothetical protein
MFIVLAFWAACEHTANKTNFFSYWTMTIVLGFCQTIALSSLDLIEISINWEKETSLMRNTSENFYNTILVFH